MSIIINLIGSFRENCVLLGNSVMSKKITTEIWDVFHEKTQQWNLDIVDGHLSLLLFFAFVMIHVRSNFFWRIFDFFQDLDLSAQFLTFLSKILYLDEISILFRENMIDIGIHKKVNLRYFYHAKGELFGAFIEKIGKKCKNKGKNPARPIFRADVDRFECIS